ncbi:ATP-dependent 6-phosphofructokinase [Mucisphaera calidilacus]|uniref:Pyrophosphate--fructose 6-phosphate 1-phosphotransferase n=1 Tax=Mucisphaera calidilacus TaxID=2527982 RepID=A0A518C0U9_9BACT|nr:ATP-dependent 6-phosphofructokinase [Mucisphaera calidilacus]QDU72838.1 Pyrophosphate--fructose 6-phosphate 1-phosphotransferase [Mucisphaera calidilacus]
MVRAEDLLVRRLGPCEFPSPIGKTGSVKHGVGVDDRLLYDDRLSSLGEQVDRDGPLPSFEVAGAHEKIYFDPAKTRAGIVTCGGLCPGLNDVIRGLVMVLHHRYGVRAIEGYRYGYEGLNPAFGHEPMVLTPDLVESIHKDGGTILGSSRGQQPDDVMVKFLKERGVNILFTIGGDGTQRGALDLSTEARKQGMDLAVVGLPKTIDNDVRYVEQSFGFQTAFTRAHYAIETAHNEARASRKGVGLVKLMGRHSGFIAAYATLASNDVNYCLIPEVDVSLEGEGGFVEHLDKRLERRGHAVVVVAEGFGQSYVEAEGTDKSGNKKLGDIGPWMKDLISSKIPDASIKYVDPSYLIRGLPATPHDSVLCFRLAAYAVHAAMAGLTDMLVGKWHGRFLNVPIPAVSRQRQCVDPAGELWFSVLEATGQPRAWGAPQPV